MNFLDVFIVSVSVASVVAALGIAVVVVHMVAHYFRTLPKSEAGEPYLVTEYPYVLRVALRSPGDSLFLISGRCAWESLFADSHLGEWEKPLCQKLGGGEYRMELRFYRVEGGE